MRRFLLVPLFFAVTLFATEEAPWIDYVLHPVSTFSATYQHFSRISSAEHLKRYHGEDALLEGGLYLALTPEMAFQIETAITRTHKHPWVIDQFKETGQYVFMDDAEGDAFALMAGLSLFQVPTVALHDPSFIHHAHFAFELNGSIGKEWSQGPFWLTRLWSLAGLGMGDQGSPWFRGRIVFEENMCEEHFLTAEISGQVGFGGETLHTERFKGYGPIAYRVLDGSIKYAYRLDCGLDLSLEVMQRIYSWNAPRNVTRVTAEIFYPFGLID